MKTLGRHIETKNAQGFRVGRPNKTAAGMTATHARRADGVKLMRSREPEGAVLTLQVRGSTDTLRGLAYLVRSHNVGRCPCCGQVRRVLRLNDSGRSRLKALRRKRG